jgi:hypothetical protein
MRTCTWFRRKPLDFDLTLSPERQDPANEQSKVKPARVGPEKLTSMRDRSFVVTLVGGLFFFSGFAALVYQVISMRHLSLFFGSDVYAAASEASSLIQHRFITTSQEAWTSASTARAVVGSFEVKKEEWE